MRRLAWLLLVAACKPSPPAPSTAPPAASTAKVDASAAAAASPTVEREGGGSLMDELAKEAKQRPSGTPTAEAVLDALDQGGVKIERRKQVLGRTVDASFCIAALIAAGSVAVCEYPDEQAAAKGRDVSLEKFKALANRQIFVNKKTTLTLISTGDAGGSDVAEKVKSIFAAL